VLAPGVATAFPAVAASLLWILAGQADVASWRMVELTGRDPAAFDLAGKVSYCALRLTFRSPFREVSMLTLLGELWRQMIGVLGLFNTVLQPWVYPMLTALLIGNFFAPLHMAPPARCHVPIVAALAGRGGKRAAQVMETVSELHNTPGNQPSPNAGGRDSSHRAGIMPPPAADALKCFHTHTPTETIHACQLPWRRAIMAL
jgi:hypothetical protein